MNLTRDMIVKREKGSSLDASADDDRTTSKVRHRCDYSLGQTEGEILEGENRRIEQYSCVLTPFFYIMYVLIIMHT
jgi:hypothetical protein